MARDPELQDWRLEQVQNENVRLRKRLDRTEAVVDAARALDEAGCWGHSEHGAERCSAGALRAALRAYEDAE